MKDLSDAALSAAQAQQTLALPKGLELNSDYRSYSDAAFSSSGTPFIVSNEVVTWEKGKPVFLGSFKDIHISAFAISRKNVPIAAFTATTSSGKQRFMTAQWLNGRWMSMGEVTYRNLGSPIFTKGQLLETKTGWYYISRFARDCEPFGCPDTHVYFFDGKAWRVLPSFETGQSLVLTTVTSALSGTGELFVIVGTQSKNVSAEEEYPAKGVSEIAVYKTNGKTWQLTGKFPVSRSILALGTDSKGQVTLARVQNKQLIMQRWTGKTWLLVGQTPIINDIKKEDVESRLAFDAQGNAFISIEEQYYENPSNTNITILSRLFVRRANGTWQSASFGSSWLRVARVGNGVRVVSARGNQVVIQDSAKILSGTAGSTATQPIPQKIPAIPSGTTIIYDPFADEANSYKPNSSEIQFLKNLILNQTKNYWDKKDDRGFCNGDNFEIYDRIQGSFTRENARQTAYLYLFCINGEPWWNYSGVAIIENNKLIFNWAFQSAIYKLMVFRDINQNGKNEIGLVNGMVHMGYIIGDLSIVEITDNGVRDIISFSTDNANCGTVGQKLNAEVQRITVKVGSSPIFYSETFKALSPCQNRSKWQRTSGPKPLVAKNTAVSREGIIFYENPNSWLLETWYNLEQPLIVEIRLDENQFSVTMDGKTYLAAIRNNNFIFRRGNQEIKLRLDTKAERLYLGSERFTNNKQFAAETHESRVRAFTLQVFQRAYAQLARNQKILNSDCIPNLFGILAPKSVLTCRLVYDTSTRRVRVEASAHLRQEKIVLDGINFPYLNSAYENAEIQGNWYIDFKTKFANSNAERVSLAYNLLFYRPKEDLDMGRLVYSSENGDVCTYKIQWIQRYGYAIEAKLFFMQANRIANSCRVPVDAFNDSRFWLYWNPESKQLSTQLSPVTQAQVLSLVESVSNVKFTNQFVKLNPQDFTSSERQKSFTENSLSAALVTTPIQPTKRIPIIFVHGWQVFNDALNSAQSPNLTTPQIADWGKFLAQVSQVPELTDVFDFYTFGYDSSQRVKTNGQRLSQQIALYFQQPVALIGFSMGGLISDVAKQTSPKSVGAVVSMNTPYRGSRWVLCKEKNSGECMQVEVQKSEIDALLLAIKAATNLPLADPRTLERFLSLITEKDGTRDLTWQSGSRKFLKVPLSSMESNPFLESLNSTRSYPKDYLAIGSAIGSLPSYGGHDAVVTLASQFAAENYDDVPVQVITDVCAPELYKTQMWTFCIDAQQTAFQQGARNATFPWFEPISAGLIRTSAFFATALPEWFQHAHIGGGTKNNPRAIEAALNFVYTKLYSATTQNLANPQSLSTSSRTIAQATIYANQGWTATGIQVQQGANLEINAQGKWGNGQYYNDLGEIFTPMYGPDGANPTESGFTYPLSGAGIKVGALIGKIGNRGTPFLVGEKFNGIAKESGELYFTINDDLTTLSDNQGSVSVTVVKR
jgi:pimeloyl-ACP methyl ester carboxylesterase